MSIPALKRIAQYLLFPLGGAQKQVDRPYGALAAPAALLQVSALCASVDTFVVLLYMRLNGLNFFHNCYTLAGE
jgi:hypothetical protein